MPHTMYRTAAILAFTLVTLRAQSNYFTGKDFQQRMNNLQHQQDNFVLLGDPVQEERRIRTRFDPSAQVGPIPDLVPGRVVWQVTNQGPSGFQPLLFSDLVLLVNASLRLVGIELDTGKERWSLPLKSESVTQPVLAEGCLLVGLQSGDLLCLDPSTGRQIWKVALKSAKGGKIDKEEINPISQPTVRNGCLYVGTFAAGLFKTNGRLYAIGLKEGNLLWEREIQGGIAQAPVVLGDLVWAGGGDSYGAYRSTDGREVKLEKITKGSLGVPAYGAAGAVFGSGGTIYRVDPTSAEVQAIPRLTAGGGFALVGNRLVVGSGELAAVDLPMGSEAWRSKEPSIGAPVVKEGMVFQATSPKSIKVVDLATGQQVGGLALSFPQGFPLPLVNGQRAVVCERTASNGVVLESFQGASWTLAWRLEIQEMIASVPLFTSKGMILWTASGYLRLLR